MKYAVIQTGGKQYRISEGDFINVELLEASKDQRITFNEVLLVADGDKATIGTPYVGGMSVVAVVVDEVRGEKIRVSKFKAKARHRRVTGHRQKLTRLKIESVGSAPSPKEKSQTVSTVETKKPVKRVRVSKAKAE